MGFKPRKTDKVIYQWEMTVEQREALDTMARLMNKTVDEWLREAVREKIESDGNLLAWVRRIEANRKKYGKKAF